MDLAKQLREKAEGSRSGLYRWIKANYAAINRANPPDRRKNWRALTEAATEAGIKNIAGSAPTVASVRSAFLRVQAEMERKPLPRTRKARTAPDVSLVDATPPVVSTPTSKPPEKSNPPRSPETGFDESRRTRFTFKPVTPKGSYSREE
jgi:hypothetical protein